MQTQEPQIVETQGKKFNMLLAIFKIIFIGIGCVAILFTVKATFTDTTLEALEKNYSSAMGIYNRDAQAVKTAITNERQSSDHLCDAFRALKAYKESKKMPLKNDSNPCVQFSAPQQGF